MIYWAIYLLFLFFPLGTTSQSELEQNVLTSNKLANVSLQNEYEVARGKGIENFGQVPHHDFRLGVDLCALWPLENQLYYGINLVRYNDAVRCCLKRGLVLATIPPMARYNTFNHKLRMIQEAVTTAHFRVNPIGREFQLFVHVEMEKYSKKCPTVYIKSPSDMNILLDTVPCSAYHRYLCQLSGEEFIPDCQTIEFEKLETTHDLVYSMAPLPWKEAFHCCEERMQQLVKFNMDEEMRDTVLKTMKAKGLILNEEDPLFWTGAFKRGEEDMFTWPDHTSAWWKGLHTGRTEFCGAAIEKKGSGAIHVEPYACEKHLKFVCAPPQGSPCRMQPKFWNEIKVFPNAGSYQMLANAHMTYGQASACCRKKKLRLLTPISIDEGTNVAVSLQTNHSWERAFQGLTDGMWTGGRLANDKEYYHFPYFIGITNFTLEEHLYKTPNANCLTFIVNVGASFALKQTPCHVYRRFLCETSDLVKDLFDGREQPYLVDIGNRYFYGKTKMTYERANLSCFRNGMRLYQNKGKVEQALMLRGLQQHHNFTSVDAGEEDGFEASFWAHSRKAVLPINILFKEKELYRGRTPPKPLDKLYPAGFLEVLQEERCYASLVTEKRKIVQNRYMCDHKLHYICETSADPSPDVCDGLMSEPLHSHTRKMLLLSKKVASWEKAERCCREHGAELFHLTNTKADSSEMRAKLSQEFRYPHGGVWTAGTNQIVRDRFHWHAEGAGYSFIRGSSLFYHQYYDGRERTPEENLCLETYFHSGQNEFKLSHDHCYKLKRYVCKKYTTTRKAPSCEQMEYTRLGNMSSFFISKQPLPWIQAVDCCHKRGSRIAKIMTREEGMALAYWLPIHIPGLVEADFGVWIGMAKNMGTKNYKWEDGDGVRIRDGFPRVLTRNRTHSQFGDEDDDGAGDCVGVSVSPDGELLLRNYACVKYRRSLCFLQGGDKWSSLFKTLYGWGWDKFGQR